MKILVIEDHSYELQLANHILSAAGYTVSAAEAAEQAIVAIKADKPQIILLDLSLPGMDGLSLARLLKRDPDTRDIPIVAVTAYVEKFSRAEALKAGCDAYIVKPLSIRELPGQLQAVVEG
jgi:CheY-like chemotaxis protein